MAITIQLANRFMFEVCDNKAAITAPGSKGLKMQCACPETPQVLPRNSLQAASKFHRTC
jgi:hypothetical protein